MRPFIIARKHHAALDRAVAQSAPDAAAIWHAITGIGEPEPTTFAEALRETAPEEHAATLVTHEVAAALAFATMWRAWEDLRFVANLTPFARRQAAREAWVTFGELAGAVASIREGFGWDESAAWDVARDVAPRADDGRVARIARLAGRMFAAMRGANSRRVPQAPAEVYSVELGGDVERLLPSEYAQLMDPDLEGAALYRVSTRRATQYAVRGDRVQARGPIVLALDESGSMSCARNEWAKAAAIAVARVAVADRRRIAVVHWSTSVVVADLDPSSPASVLAMIRSFLSGGTDTARAVRASVDKIRELAAKGDAGADLVLVTDGIDGGTGVSAALDDAAKIGARLWTVAIECEIPADHPLRARAVSYVELGRPDMIDPRSAVSLGRAA